MTGNAYGDMLPPDAEGIFKSFSESSFQFNCHKGIGCFTECCAKLKLLLTPYDILRIKNRLGFSSDAFLAQYTDMDFGGHPRFPMVRLSMRKDEKQTCPFVSKDGCTIYEDRPGACRLYPVGRAARLTDMAAGKDGAEKFFLVKEPHCKGFFEDKTWTLAEWLRHEGVSEYNAMNDKWLKIIGNQRSLGSTETLQKKMQMFFMASYNLDRFRTFIFQSRFFELFDVDPYTQKQVEKDDCRLMQLAFDWLQFSLFGEKTIPLK